MSGQTWLAAALGLSLAIGWSTSDARELIEVQVNGEIPAEARLALAEIVSPGAVSPEWARAFAGATPVGVLGDPNKSHRRRCASRLVEADGRVTCIDQVFTPGEGMLGEASRFLSIPTDSDLAKLYAASGRLNAVEVLIPEALLPTELLSNANVPRGVGSTIERLESGAQSFGTSMQWFELNESSRASFLLLQSVLESSGAGTARIVSDVPQVDPGHGQVRQQSAPGSACTGSSVHWDEAASRIANVLEQNAKVLDALGLAKAPSARVLVVDSGVPGELANSPGFRPYLAADPVRLLNPSGYLMRRDTGAVSCVSRLPPKERGIVAYGYVLSEDSENQCVAENPIRALAPPDVSAYGYVPEHGGVVGVIAAGGPSLMRNTSTSKQSVGVLFARIMTSREGRLVSSPNAVVEALSYASELADTIVNVSLRVEQGYHRVLVSGAADLQERSLVVAAAGNSSGRLLPRGEVFPASAASGQVSDPLIIVGGVDLDDNGNPVPWVDSAWSPTLVDIAAPAVDVPSLGAQAQDVCVTGTSAAAPQVSFVAAALLSLGLPTGAHVKRRILATATEHAHLAERVRDGRVLDAATALDVFADKVWLIGKREPITGELLEEGGSTVLSMLRVCEGTDAEDPLVLRRGWIDPSQLLLWRNVGNGVAQLWIEEGPRFISGDEVLCRIPATVIHLRQPGGDMATLPMSAVQRIVPSRYRRAMALRFAVASRWPRNAISAMASTTAVNDTSTTGQLRSRLPLHR